MLNREPAMINGAVAELVRQLLLTLVVFELVKWTAAQQAQLMMLVSGALTVATILLTRQRSVSMAVADRQIEIAKASSIDTPTDQIIKEAKEST